MPNLNRPSGLSPVKYLLGADWDGKVGSYVVLAADANPYYMGDLVTLTGTGDTQGRQGVTLATAGNPAVGVVVAGGINPFGPYINPNNLSQAFVPAAKGGLNYYLAVVDDPNVIFEVQEGGAGPTLAANRVSRNANIVYAAPATGVNVSGMQMDDASQAVTATLNLKLLGLSQRYSEGGGLNAYGAFAKWLCLINNHQYKGTGVLGL